MPEDRPGVDAPRIVYVDSAALLSASLFDQTTVHHAVTTGRNLGHRFFTSRYTIDAVQNLIDDEGYGLMATCVPAETAREELGLAICGESKLDDPRLQYVTEFVLENASARDLITGAELSADFLLTTVLSRFKLLFSKQDHARAYRKFLDAFPPPPKWHRRGIDGLNLPCPIIPKDLENEVDLYTTLQKWIARFDKPTDHNDS